MGLYGWQSDRDGGWRYGDRLRRLDGLYAGQQRRSDKRSDTARPSESDWRNKKQPDMKKVLFIFAMTVCVCQMALAHTDFGERPKLVVGIVVDQMRWDYLSRYYDQFGDDGFKRLIKKGYSCDNCLINCEKNYIDLINQIKAKKTKKLIDEFLEMRLDISKRIEELEDYFDENFGNIRMNILEKGIFQLKKLLFYNPDKKNDQEEEDLPEFTGLVLDFNLIEKNNIANQNFAKNMRQSNIKTAQDIKMRATMRATMRASKFPQNLRKTKIDGSSIRDTGINSGFNNRLRATSINIKEKDEIIENDNLEENNIEYNNIPKKKVRIRLTDEEYRLLQKLKAKKKTGK